MTDTKIFIPSSPETMLEAKLAKHSIERKLPPHSRITVEIIPDTPLYEGRSLARFTAPERMSYAGTAVVIEPNMFAVRDISPIFEIKFGGNRIAAVRRGAGWSTNLLYIDAATLTDWSTKEFVRALDLKLVSIESFFTLAIEPDVLELPAQWDHRDALSTDTRILRITNPDLYPWRPIRKQEPSLWAALRSVLGSKRRTQANTLPNKHVRLFLTDLLGSAIASGAVDARFLKAEIAAGRMRSDALTPPKR